VSVSTVRSRSRSWWCLSGIHCVGRGCVVYRFNRRWFGSRSRSPL